MGRKIKFPVTFSLLLIILLFYSSCCNTTEPPDPPPPPPPVVEEPILTLELDDAHCTETWIILKTEKLTLPAELTLKQFNPSGDSITQILNLNTKDTRLYIDSLLPNQIYRYQVSGIWNPKPDSQQIVTSNEINVTTMDTTSHSFTFEMITFGGEIGSSVLYDVAIIDESNFIAVGEIYLIDSTGAPDPQPYSIAIWNGLEWKIQKLFYTSDLLVSPIRGISVVGSGEIYLSAGSIFRWNGYSNYAQMVFHRSSLPDPNATVEKLWSQNSSQIYGVGNRGTIVYYNGTQWSRIESGTTLNINDIWGDYNPKTGEWEILAVASNYGSSFEKELIMITNNLTQKLPLSSNVWPLRTVWFIPGRQYYIAGSGIYQKRLLTDSLWKNEALDITEYGTTSIRGKSINDLFAVGAFGDFLHFNGVSWRQYQESYLSNGAYTKVTVKGNLVVAVGGNQVSLASEAVILIGRR